jgi:hypothetical protein
MIPPAPAHPAIAVAFALLAAACWSLAAGPAARDVRMWRLAAAALAALAVDQGFGILEQATAAARAWAVEGGWYDERRLFQRWLVLGIGAAGFVAFALWLRRRRPFSLESAAALAGVLFLVCLALARASSQHRVDAFLAAPAAFGLRWRAVLEMVGIAVAALAAALALVRRRRASPYNGRTPSPDTPPRRPP